VPFLALLVAAAPLRAADPGAPASLHTAPVILLLIEDRGCPYCARWDREVREAYLNSPEGRFAPLVRRFRGAADIAFVPNVAYSPTFVVLERGREVGRIIGYSGPDFFWAELGNLLKRAGYSPGG
jgi:hypothetical protein